MIRYLNLLSNVSNWYLHFLLKFGLSKKDFIMFRTRKGILVEVPLRLYREFKEIFMDNAYFIGLKRPLKENSIIIDIGANVGFFSLFAISKLPNANIYAYEPFEANFKQLLKNVAMNKISSILCFNKAVAGYSGRLRLYIDKDENFQTGISIFYPKNKEVCEELEVDCITLDQVLTENNINCCDLLKLDCEGSEYEILYNASSQALRRIHNMAMEVHEGPLKYQNIQSLEAFLKRAGFKTYRLRNKRHMLWALNLHGRD